MSSAERRENTGRKQGRGPDGKFRKGSSGNPAGRPRGALNRTTRAAQELLDGQAEALTRALIDKALDGDVAALRLAVERIIPPKRTQPMDFDLGRLETLDDVQRVFGCIADAISEGSIGTVEIDTALDLIKEFLKVYEIVEFERRLSAVESTLRDAAA